MHCRDGEKGMSLFTTGSPSGARVAERKYRLTSRISVIFFDGRVPCRRYAHVRLKSGHSDCMVHHVDHVVNGSLDEPSKTSSAEIDVFRTTHSSVCCTNEHTWQPSSRHSAALRLAKSDGRIADPFTWRIDI